MSNQGFVWLLEHRIHVIKDQEGNLWFSAKHVANTLGYKSPRCMYGQHNTVRTGLCQYYDLTGIRRGNVLWRSLYLNEITLSDVMSRSRLPLVRAARTENRLVYTLDGKLTVTGMQQDGSVQLDEIPQAAEPRDIAEVRRQLRWRISHVKRMEKNLQNRLQFHSSGTLIVVSCFETISRYRMTIKYDNGKRRKLVYGNEVYRCQSRFPRLVVMCLGLLLWEARDQLVKTSYICPLTQVIDLITVCNLSVPADITGITTSLLKQRRNGIKDGDYKH